MIYVDQWDKYIDHDDFEYELECRLEEDEIADDDVVDYILSLHIYGTTINSAKFDAQDLLSRETEDLHEYAFERSKHVMKELQEYLDTISEKIIDDTMTYYQDEKTGIQLTLDDIKGWDCVNNSEKEI